MASTSLPPTRCWYSACSANSRARLRLDLEAALRAPVLVRPPRLWRGGRPEAGVDCSSLMFGLWFGAGWPDRKSTRLNSSHLVISYAVFCLKKKTDEA